MASSMADTEPLCDVSIIKTERVDLVEKVAFENVMPSIHPYLLPNQRDEISGEKTQFAKMRKVLTYINYLAKCSQYRAFNALMKAIAGTQPELFKRLVGRAPTEAETIFCVKDIVEQLKENIIKTGHCTDSELDEEISFEYEHVELSMVGTSGSEAEHKVPHVYGDHLTQLERKGRNISACDILNSKGKPNEKVLIFGRPGVGKSTTTQWLARQWALGKWATGVTLLFLLQVRFLSNVDVPITASELLSLYSLYQLEDMADSLVLSSWLKNPASRILIFADGLDEIPGFASRMINTHRIRDLTHKAHPIDLIVNILRGDLLPHSVVISASRPFLGLSSLHVDSKAEVLGLTSTKVTEYVKRRYPGKANHILSVLSKSPILLSVCGITFYCMMISRLLSEGVELMDEDIQTYTRLMAFILVQYTNRKITGSDFSLEMSPYVTRLASMAHSGIFRSQESTKLAKLVFDRKDLINSKLSINDLDCLKKTGIIQIREYQIGGHRSTFAEFFHLSGQEMLAVLHFLSNSQHSDDVFHKLFSVGHFDMALIYTFGLHFDRTSKWVDELWTAMGSSGPADTSITSQLRGPGDDTSITSQLPGPGVDTSITSQLPGPGDDTSITSELSDPGDDTSITSELSDPGDDTSITLLLPGPGDDTSITSEFSRPHADIAANLEQSLSRIRTWINRIKAVMCFSGPDAETSACSELSGPGVDTSIISQLSLFIDRLLNESKNKIKACQLIYEGQWVEKAKEVFGHIAPNGELSIDGNTMIAIDLLSVDFVCRCGGSLSSVKLNKVHADATFVKVMMSSLVKHNLSTLQVLDLSDNTIGADGVMAIADYLSTGTHGTEPCSAAPSLTTLSISHNKLGDEGAQGVAVLLNTNTGLTSLDISHNNIQGDGAKVVAEALVSNTSLTQLYISDNKIGDVGAKAVGDMLKLNNSIQILHMCRNRIGHRGVEAMAPGLHQNTTLTELDIRDNDFMWIDGFNVINSIKPHVTLLF